MGARLMIGNIEDFFDFTSNSTEIRNIFVAYQNQHFKNFHKVVMVVEFQTSKSRVMGKKNCRSIMSLVYSIVKDSKGPSI